MNKKMYMHPEIDLLPFENIDTLSTSPTDEETNGGGGPA